MGSGMVPVLKEDRIPLSLEIVHSYLLQMVERNLSDRFLSTI